ncbi:MAG: hypothetical protein PF904_05910 [Kiritimatiellae bacterium]|nr:hypothetical protein [Kiritimatiellia bacterium]
MKILQKFIIIALMLLAGIAAAEPAAWAVKDATVRFVVKLTTEPSHPEAGYFVKIPDGGVLPGPRPECIVVDEAGNPLKSGILWHCKDTECGVVFQRPEAGQSATIYFQGTRKSNIWTPASGIKPGAFLCEQSGTRSKSAAHKLGNFGVVDSKTRFVNQGWDAGSYNGQLLPLATWEWRLGGNAVYMLSYIDVKNPGPTWIAPYSRSGQLDIFVDGKEVKQKKKNEKVGGIGGTVTLTKGLHRVDLYGYDLKNKATGPMMFTWRTPKTTIEELGGPREKEHRYPGTSMNESCVPDISDIVKSGECRITDVNAQDGPAAAFIYEPNATFWLDEEVPMISYAFKSLAENNPKDTKYSWRFEVAPKAVADGAETSWLLNAGSFTKVSLTAESEGKSSTASYVVYPHTDIESSMDDPDTRYNFKLACYNMLRAYPENVDPVADWGPSMWKNFFRVMELNRKNVLLEYIMTQRWDYFKKKIDPENKALMQDVFLFTLAPRDPKKAFKWAGEFSSDEFTAARSSYLKLKKAEILMYYIDDMEGARRVIAPLLRDAGEGGEWAKIRMGDWEFLSRHLNQATQRYGDVQSRSKALAQEFVPTQLTPIGSGATKKFVKPKKPAEESVMGKELNSVKAERQKNKNKPEVPDMYIPMQEPASVPEWKIAAVRDVAASENISVLIDQEFYLEAFLELRRWERALPMSKISGDLILREAKFYMVLQDYKRARIILSAYCEQVDVSNFLPEAMNMIKSCMIEMKEPAAAIEEYEKEIMKRTIFGAGEE